MLLFAMSGERCRADLWLVLCCSLFVASLRCEAQNLVPNPSFELKDTCPYTIGFQEGDRPLDWFPWDQTPEYFNACAPGTGVDSLVGVPWNGFTWQYAKDGDAYVGMTCFEPNDFREHVGAQLLQPMVVGQTYYVSFWVNLATEGSYWETRWACNNQGILFTMQEHIWSGNTGSGPEFQPRNYAHVNHPALVTDTAGWTLVSGSFVADSAYQYVVLGNFFDDAHTDTLHFGSGPSIAAYYLYDAICVSPTPGQCPISTSVQEQQAEAVRIAVLGTGQWLQIIGAEVGSNAQVYDGQGKLLDRFVAGPSTVHDVQGLSTGVYVLRLQGARGSGWSGKFVVMH
jgi:hypothetical protein